MLRVPPIPPDWTFSAWCHHHNMTQEQAAELFGVLQPQISRWYSRPPLYIYLACLTIDRALEQMPTPPPETPHRRRRGIIRLSVA